MKIPEKELREIIRAQILAERFSVELIPMSRIKACKIDIPPEYDMRSLSLAASDAMNLYGVPGSFCDLVNQLIPGKKRDRGSSSGQGSERPGRPESIVLLASVTEALENINVLFVEGIDDRNPTDAQVNNAKDDYEQKLRELGRKSVDNDPDAVAVYIVETVFSNFGEVREVKKNIRKVSDQGDEVIVQKLVEEGKVIMRLEALKNIQLKISSTPAGSSARLALENYKTIVETS